MNRTAVIFTSLVVVSACVVYKDKPAQTGGTGAPPSGTTTAPAPNTTATSTPTNTVATNPTPPTPATTSPTPPGTMPTGFPTGGFPPPPTGGAFTFPGVCIPIGSWTKQFDNGIPASGTVEIGTPVIFNQFPVNDGVVIANAPVGSLKGTGAMTSTNDLSVDVTNAGYVVSYTCHFSGTNCNQGACTVTKGSLGGFKLVKK